MHVLACLHGDSALEGQYFRNRKPTTCVESSGSYRNLDHQTEMRTPKHPLSRALVTHSALEVVAAWKHRCHQGVIEEATIFLDGPRNHLVDANSSFPSNANLCEA